MTQPNDIEGLKRELRGVADGREMILTYPWPVLCGLMSKAAAALDEAGMYTEAHERLDDLARERVAAAEERVSALLSELEAVKGENARLETEVLNAAFSDRLDMEAGGSPLTWKEIALSAEAALVSLKGGGGSSVAESGSTASPKSDGLCKSEGEP